MAAKFHCDLQLSFVSQGIRDFRLRAKKSVKSLLRRSDESSRAKNQWRRQNRSEKKRQAFGQRGIRPPSDGQTAKIAKRPSEQDHSTKRQRTSDRQSVISSEPPIIMTGMAFEYFLGLAPAFGKTYPSLPAAFLIYPCWTIEDPRRSAEVINAAEAHLREHPAHQLVFLCNTAAETDLLVKGGLNAILLNKNFTVSTRFSVLSPTAKLSLMRFTMPGSILRNVICSRKKSHGLPTFRTPQTRLTYVSRESWRPKSSCKILVTF